MTEIRIDFDFGHPPALVWRALTERRQLARWFMPGDLQPIQGSQFQLLPEALPGFDGPISGQVLEVSAEWRLVMRWKGEQLHTRMAWELKPRPDGCLLAVYQSGFLGVRGSARRQALVSTYDKLFGERLPVVLDGLAGKGDAVVPRPPRLAPPPPPRPNRRRQLLALAAAVVLLALAGAFLASLPSRTSAPAAAGGQSGTSAEAASHESPAPTLTATGVEATRRPPSASPSAPAPSPTSAAPPPTTRPAPTVERTTAPAASPAALSARYSTLSTNPLGYRGEVTVRNTGDSASERWTLTITLPLLAVATGVDGPRPSQSGGTVTFSGAAVPAGGSARVVFDVVLDITLLGSQKPLSCELSGGEDCAGL